MTEARPTLRRGLVVVLGALLGALLASGCFGPAGARGGLSSEQISTLPPEVSQAYEVFARRCSRCHSLARPLNAQVDDVEHWRRYVARMRRNPGSAITPDEADVILKFLSFYVNERKHLTVAKEEP